MAALMAKDGFTGAPAITVENEDAAQFWADLGEVWTIELDPLMVEMQRANPWSAQLFEHYLEHLIELRQLVLTMLRQSVMACLVMAASSVGPLGISMESVGSI